MLARLCIQEGLKPNIPQSFESLGITGGSLDRPIVPTAECTALCGSKPAEGFRLWHLMTVSVPWQNAVVHLVVTSSEHVSACSSGMLSEYKPVMAYIDSCRLVKKKKLMMGFFAKNINLTSK